MHFNPEQQIERVESNQESLVAAGNIIQLMLAEKRGESIDDFIDRHAEAFRKIADENPSWLIEFSKDPDGILARFESAVYH